MNNDQVILHTEFIVTIDAFCALSAEWDELLDNATANNPFLSHQWLLAWWQEYGKGELQLLTIRGQNNKLLGILPLYRRIVFRIFPVRVLKLMGSSRVSSDFLECIVRKNCEQIVYKACLEALKQTRCSWDILQLQDMAQDSQFYKYIYNSHIPGIETSCDPGKVCPYLTLPDSWQILLNGLSANVRQKVGRYRRGLEKIGKTELEQVTDAADLHQALSDVIRLRKDRMKQKGLSSSKVTNNYIRFNKNVMQRFIACNRLRLYFLKVNDKRVAYIYLFSAKDTIYFYQTGFDSLWSHHRVGFVLMGMVLEKSIEDGFKRFEFLRGDERYKYEWGEVKSTQLVDVNIARRTLPAMFMLESSRVLIKIKKIIKSILSMPVPSEQKT